MRIPFILFSYLARQFTGHFLALLLILLSLIYVLDGVELLRRASGREGVGLATVAQLGLMKLPEVGQQVIAFAVLAAALFTIWKLNRRYELVVLRASGVSVWQFLVPMVGVALSIGVIWVGAINPLGAALLSRYNLLETEIFDTRDSLIDVDGAGLWLRQATEDGYILFHGKDVAPETWRLGGVIAFHFNTQDQMTWRVDAPEAVLRPGAWVLRDARVNVAGESVQRQPVYTLPTDLTPRQIEDSFASPQTLSFWQLLGTICTMEQNGFRPTRLKAHFHTLLSRPILLVAMVLIAAVVAMRLPRRQDALFLVVSGLLLGFIVFFSESFLVALAVSNKLPVVLAAWTPCLVMTLLAMTALLNLEDG